MARNDDDFRGVTDIILGSYQVLVDTVIRYPNGHEECKDVANFAAILRGFDTSWSHYEDNIIVVPLQFQRARIITAFEMMVDAAFDAGTVIIAANGNDGYEDSTVMAPASAHKAIGVGAYEIDGGNNTFNLQSRGPTPDGRIKPDIQAPPFGGRKPEYSHITTSTSLCVIRTATRRAACSLPASSSGSGSPPATRFRLAPGPLRSAASTRIGTPGRSTWPFTSRRSPLHQRETPACFGTIL